MQQSLITTFKRQKYNYPTNLFYLSNIQWLEYLEESHVEDAPRKHAHLQRRVASMQKDQSEAFAVRGQLFADVRIKSLSIKNCIDEKHQ